MVLDSGEGTTSGAADQARPVVTWEVAPLRAAALRNERAVNQRWQTLRAAILGAASLLAVIGGAAALSLLNGPNLPGGMGFLSANVVPSASPSVSASDARDGGAIEGPPAPPADEDETSAGESHVASEPAPAAGNPAAPAAETPRATPTATPTPAPEPSIAPTPEPAPSVPPVESEQEDEDHGLIGNILDLLLPGLLG